MRTSKKAILAALHELYPDARPELNFTNPYETLVAVMLSAQCTDKMVNKVTPAVFARYPDVASMAAATVEDLHPMVKACGFKSKATNIIETCKLLMLRHGGEVPRTMEELTALPGVGRKTANLLLGDLYDTPGSVVCDTHCIRICGRLGLSKGKEPEKVERQLRQILPPEESNDFCHRIVLFGREICTARKPKCTECPLAMHCQEVNLG